jgi:hypothetical protein
MWVRDSPDAQPHSRDACLTPARIFNAIGQVDRLPPASRMHGSDM